MRNLQVLLTILTTMTFFSCNKVPDLQKEEVYNILNEIIADDSLYLPRLCRNADIVAIEDDYGFDQKDKLFIERQNRLFKNFKFESGKLKYFSRHNQSSDFVEIDSSCDKGILNHFSFPLISADKQKVLIENTEDCNCMLGGQGSTSLYIKKDGHWKLEKSFVGWISKRMTESGGMILLLVK